MTGLRYVLAAAFAFLAAACFYSEEELIGFWGADRALEPGFYTHTPFHPEGGEWGRPTWAGEIAYENRRYSSQVANFPHPGARLHRLDGDIYIVQWERQDGVGYAIAFDYPGMLTYHMPDCSALRETVRDEAGVVLGPEGYCRIDSLSQLEDVMRLYLRELDGDVRLDGIYRRADADSWAES
jgi:hypothetical protein